MKKAKKLLLQAASLIMAAVMFTGCYYPLTSKQKGWISQIEKYYPDDTFTYVGHSTVSMGVTSPSCISLESENFPHVDVQIYEVDGKLYSNYPLYYHKEAVMEYFSDLIISCFGCDYVELEMTDTADKPLKYVSDEKYIEKYAIHHYIAYVYYEEGHAYPTEDELEEMALDYFQHITTDNDDRGNAFRLCFVRPGGSKKHNDLDMNYTFGLHDGVASLYNDKEKSYVFKGPLEDLI